MAEPANIFSGLKVVDFASFIAGPGTATILSDFGAVVKVEPPTDDPWRNGHKLPPQPEARIPISGIWPTATSTRSESAERSAGSRAAGEVGRCTHRQHAARKKLKLEYDDVVQWNQRLIYADLTGFGEKGPDADLPGFDITAYWARTA